MVKIHPGLTLFLLLCSLGLPAGAVPQYDSAGTSAAAQDASGIVWALPADSYNTDGTLNRWQAGGWAAQKIPGAAGFHPYALTRGGDGSVYAFWQKPNQGQNQILQCLVTVHRGIGSRILARFSGAVFRAWGFPRTPKIYAGNTGDVWVTSDQPMLWHIAPDGVVQTFPLKPEQYFGGKLPDQYQYGSSVLASLVDGAGRRWFWHETSDGWQPNGLRGVLIWDGTALNYHPALPGVPDEPFSVMTPRDAGHFWLATGSDHSHARQTDGALYRLDTQTLAAVPEPTPERRAFQVAQVFQANGDWYALEQPFGAAGRVLWRRHDGQWQVRQDQLEESGDYSQPGTRFPWLAEPSGVWLGVRGGAWWLPRGDKPPCWINWRRGLPALNVSGLFPLTDGNVLAVGDAQGAAEIPPTPQPIRPLPPGLVTGGMGAPKGIGPLCADPQRHLWGTHYLGPTASLDEWNGSRWRMHLMPKGSASLRGLYACDTRGRLWLATYMWHPPAQPQPVEGYTVYDPAHDTWTKYDTAQDALQAAAALPGMMFQPHRDLYNPPLFSGDGRVTYADNAAVYLYDGKAWRHWAGRDIIPGYPYSNQPGPPHFNSNGHLEVTLDNHVYEWTPADGWRQTGVMPPIKYEDPVPPGGPHGLFWGTPAIDDSGAKWFVWNDAVYKAWHGLWAKQDALSGPGSPFRYGYDMEDALRDPAGRIFFVSRPAGFSDLVVWTPPRVPSPIISVTPLSDDAVKMRFQTNLRGRHWFLWRFHGSAWNAPTAAAADTVTLTGLLRGDYRIEAQALDSSLQPSVPLAVAVFSIRVAPGVQIARWVSALLNGTDEAREAAVAGLIKQPAAALPALQEARPAASEEGRWWLDAAIQQITDQHQQAENAGN